MYCFCSIVCFHNKGYSCSVVWENLAPRIELELFLFNEEFQEIFDGESQKFVLLKKILQRPNNIVLGKATFPRFSHIKFGVEFEFTVANKQVIYITVHFWDNGCFTPYKSATTSLNIVSQFYYKLNQFALHYLSFFQVP